MSAIVKLTLNDIKDKPALVEALKSLGFKDVEVADGNSLDIIGYYGKAWGKGEVRVPKASSGRVADIGFEKSDAYSMLVDHIDEHRLDQKYGATGAFRQNLQQWYNAHLAANTLQQQGYSTNMETQTDGAIRVTATAYA